MCETAAMNGFATGRLFEPHTQYFNDKVDAEAKDVFSGGTNYAWIGINDKGGSWVYTSSGTELEFENWHSGQPTNYGDCVRVDSHNGQWRNANCNQQKFFICEFV